ncbi:MAG: hypothetical protein WCK28_21310 [Burkholderiales bacterium]
MIPHPSGSFLRRTAATVAASALAACAALGPSGVVVTGTGDPAKDVAAVQAAVDAGGRVTLAGTFDFGDRGRVTLERDVEVAGAPGATIRGGFFTFFAPVPATPDAPGTAAPRIVIRDLAFTGALWAPINVGHASALVVRNTRIASLRAHPLPMPGIPDGQAVAGILLGSAWAQPVGPGRRPMPESFGGPVTIADNVIDVRTDRPASTLGYGIYAQWTGGMEAVVSGNAVTGATRTAFEAIDNWRGPDGRGRITVRDNRLETADAGLPFPGKQTPNGVLVGYFSDRKAATDPARAVPIELAGNRIETHGATSMGIAVLADGVRVTDNTVTGDGEQSVGLMVAGSGAEVVHNTLRGRGAVGLVVNPSDPLAASRNRLVDNDLDGFVGARGQLVLTKGAADNVCSGRAPGKVVDDGERNRCR